MLKNEGVDDILFETLHWKIILSNDQRYIGRCVIILKRPCGTLAHVKNDEWIDFARNVVEKLEAAFRQEFGATMFNWTCLMNDTYLKNPPQPQVHWHCRPRYQHSVEVSGQTFHDPNFGIHYQRRNESVLPEERIDVPEKIRREICRRVQQHIQTV